MIQAVSRVKDFHLPKVSDLPKLPKLEEVFPQDNSDGISLADSFIKNTAEAAPYIIGTSAAFSFLDAKSRCTSFKSSMQNYTKNFFGPMLVISSAVAAVFENYVTTEQSIKRKQSNK